MGTATIQAVRGMNDVLPDEAALWQRIEDAARDTFAQYGYRNLRVPIVEPTALFVRGIGDGTDIVEHEMYTFDDHGESLTLRPEATAGIVRAAIEHHLTYDRPQRVWTAGPMFRHERPQKGRYRQFHQFDVEALAFAGPDVDAEQIIMLGRLWKRLGLDGMALQINSIGDARERHTHRRALTGYFRANFAKLDADSQRRLESNPLRILDSKNPEMQAVVAGAPQLFDLLSDDAESRRHFSELQGLLQAAGVRFEVNPNLVRGLDYYNRTVFEWITTRLGAQGTVAGGGRYDGLFEQLGGAPTPACGFAIGIERLVLLLREARAVGEAVPDAYVVHVGAAPAAALALATGERLRDAGLAVVVHAGGGSFKVQMKRADASGARWALIVGDDEVAANRVAVKPLRASGEQIALPPEDVAAHIRAAH
ncbi:MAG TPA: histidine--tRNA ligase [Casimicrobiaceae bacterium]|nr:histidine--tRNA ligase [Casimicrobiaceae bacterium]